MGDRRQPTPQSNAFVGVAALLVVVFLLGMCVGQSGAPTTPAPATGATDSPTSTQTVLRTSQVRTSRANCRARAAPSAQIVTSVPSGNAIDVLEESAGWSRVRWLNQTCWIATRLLGEPSAAAQQFTAAPASDYRVPSSTSGDYSPNYARSSRRSHRSHRSAAPFYGDDFGCSCRSHRVCIGPRGGRYCITSGGNKRYGV